MANASTTGFGFRMAEMLGNTPATQGQSKYLIETAPGVGLYQNNPVSRQDSGGSQGYLQDVSFATTDDGGTGGASYTTASHALLVGVLNGVFYVADTTKKPTWAGCVAASTAFATNPNTNSTDGWGFVNDAPLQEYIVKCDAAVTQAMRGTCFNTNNFSAGSAKNCQSTVTLDISGATAAETMMFRVVRSAEDPENEDITAAGLNAVVVMNGAANLYTNGRDS